MVTDFWPLEPLEFEQTKKYSKVPLLAINSVSLPFVAFAPPQLPDAIHVVAYEVDHDNVIELPTTIDVWSAVNEFITGRFVELPDPPLESDEDPPPPPPQAEIRKIETNKLILDDDFIWVLKL